MALFLCPSFSRTILTIGECGHWATAVVPPTSLTQRNKFLALIFVPLLLNKRDRNIQQQTALILLTKENSTSHSTLGNHEKLPTFPKRSGWDADILAQSRSTGNIASQ